MSVLLQVIGETWNMIQSKQMQQIPKHFLRFLCWQPCRHVILTSVVSVQIHEVILRDDTNLRLLVYTWIKSIIEIFSETHITTNFSLVFLSTDFSLGVSWIPSTCREQHELSNLRSLSYHTLLLCYYQNYESNERGGQDSLPLIQNVNVEQLRVHRKGRTSAPHNYVCAKQKCSVASSLPTDRGNTQKKQRFLFGRDLLPQVDIWSCSIHLGRMAGINRCLNYMMWGWSWGAGAVSILRLFGI